MFSSISHLSLSCTLKSCLVVADSQTYSIRKDSYLCFIHQEDCSCHWTLQWKSASLCLHSACGHSIYYLKNLENTSLSSYLMTFLCLVFKAKNVSILLKLSGMYYFSAILIIKKSSSMRLLILFAISRNLFYASSQEINFLNSSRDMAPLLSSSTMLKISWSSSCRINTPFSSNILCSSMTSISPEPL